MRAAVVDLGTNTVRLLVAEVRPGASWTTVHAEQRVTRLGEGVRATGALGDVPMTRTAAAVTDYVTRSRALGASAVRITGWETSSSESLGCS